MTQHTPGPWTIAHGKLVGNGYNIASINSSATTEGKANAQLMASAPELLQALREIEEGTYDKWSEGYRTQQIARDVIAKATTL